MKKTHLIFLLLLIGSRVFAQKPVIDFNAIEKWPSVGHGMISNDGNYFLCPNYNGRSTSTLIIKSVKNNWQKELPNCSKGDFSPGSGFAFIVKKDSLGILTLGTDVINYISNVRSYKFPTEGTREWLAYQLKSPAAELNVVDLKTGEKRSYADVTRYYFSGDGSALIIGQKDAGIKESLHWVDLASSQDKVIWQGDALAASFASQDDHIAFVSSEAASGNIGLWYYKKGMPMAADLSSSGMQGVDTSLAIKDEDLIFSKHGDKLFFKLIEKFKPKPATGIQVDVWGYADKKIQSEQWYDGPQNPHSYLAAIDLSNKDNNGSVPNNIIRLESESENILLDEQDLAEFNGNHILIGNHREYTNSSWWRGRDMTPAIFSVSLIDGTRTTIKKNSLYGAAGFRFPPSPSGRYFVYFDPVLKAYFSYDVLNKQTRNISKLIRTSLLDEIALDQPRTKATSVYNYPSSAPVDLIGWIEEDNAVLISDNYDIWKVDLVGQKPPVNLTKGYGLAHHIKFRILNSKMSDNFKPDEQVTLSAFNTLTKYAGFYQLKLNGVEKPLLLSMGPYAYGKGGQSAIYFYNFIPLKQIKAKHAEGWVVNRMSFNQAPNYFYTSDFKSFQALTDIEPQRHYNWMTKELVRWKAPDGKMLTGILYKPENFDPKKKYPLLVASYDKISDGLFTYHKAEYSDGALSEPYFISRGYLLFTPDIRFKTGHPGESALNSVVSGVNYLRKYKFIDFNRLGIFGVSFSGFHTNYIVTHSHLFKAAFSCCGVSDIISHTGYVMNGYTANTWTEIGQLRMGASLWERPDLYISNSPIFKADQITTPLLIMNNKKDEGSDFSQGLAMYMAMRRLKKPAWLLQYDNGVHGVGGKDAIDLTIRLTQFYDHYLKGTPPPKWMTEGIPMRLKGIETEYELDNSGKKP